MVLFFLLFILPLAIFFLLSLKLYRMKKSGLGKWGFYFSSIGALFIGIFYLYLLSRQTSSTSGIGILFLPFILIIGGTVFGALGWFSCQIADGARLLRGTIADRFLLAVSILVVVGFSLGIFNVTQRVSTFFWLKNHDIEEKTMEGYFSRAIQEKDYFLLSGIARNRSIPKKLLSELAFSSDPLLHEKRTGWIQIFDSNSMAVIRHVLRNKKLPKELIPLLSKSKNQYVLGDVASHRLTSSELLRHIHENNEGYLISYGLASNPNTPAEILKGLYSDENGYINHSLAGNSNTPLEVLLLLSKNPDRFVRRYVAWNPSIDEKIMKGFLDDPEEEVRFYLTLNGRLTKEVINSLTQDSSEKIRKMADLLLKKQK